MSIKAQLRRKIQGLIDYDQKLMELPTVDHNWVDGRLSAYANVLGLLEPESQAGLPDGRYVPAQPLPFYDRKQRMRRWLCRFGELWNLGRWKSKSPIPLPPS